MTRRVLGLILGTGVLCTGCWDRAIAPDAPSTRSSPAAHAPLSGTAIYPQGDAERALFYADGMATLHAARMRDIALSGGGDLGPGVLTAGHANAFFENGATWAVEEEASLCVVSSGDGWETLSGGVDPHGNPSRRRALNAEEQALIAALAAGADEARLAGKQVYGLPLRREAACVSCHPGPEGALLGAAIYRLLEIADD